MEKITPIKVRDYRISDGFWSNYQKLVTEVVIPYQQDILYDRVEGAEKSHAIENFRIAAGAAEGEFYGQVFQDSDVAKWIEAAAYSIMLHADKKLESDIDEVIDVIERAQQPDGYIDTYFIIKEPEHRWQNLQEGHELYCTGHMLEAAIAYYEATGKDKLLNVMKRMIDHIIDRFGKDKIRGIPGHPEIELALMRLYSLTKDKKYMELAEYFIDERGTEPNFFVEERKKRDWTIWNSDPFEATYTQNYAPVREQKDAVGHAVRAVYLYAGMADIAAFGDESLKKACEELWQSITQRRMYVTGAIGSAAVGEAFTADYDLPNDTAYAETCAAIGLIFFAHRMLQLTPNSKYGDTMERALYNCVLAGMQLDGKRFFYVNPLEVNPEYDGKITGYKHVLPERPKWFGCACCPPNVARLITSLGQYCWTESEDTIYSHLFIGGTADFETTKGCKVKVETGFPYDGKVAYRVIPKSGKTKVRLAIRIPDWSKNTCIFFNGEKIDINSTIEDGYAYIEKCFDKNDLLELCLDMTPHKVYANTAVREDIGCAAIQRGPLVYCFEGIDNDQDLNRLRIARNANITEKFEKNLLNGIAILKVSGYKMTSLNGLYSNQRPSAQSYELTAMPYYTWGNRGLNQMKVWLAEE
ncbi:glycoside hydrolase family 127 protein [Clostridium oryzae]|uniref:Non-reducing end beta-L-arabinofuranosidase n=1 Tax=Clostridium oryzae TaxID=1450648 RepID=A0A1V4INE5_9CLOT|nr:beta-L-arabinofuranosidase domain-containing protein [Clostridium oryzae]OPJ61561.1 Non-reducing end beta-L-arabinofuranosidase [Clostridium oryzae]